MPAALPPVLTVARRGQPLARVMAVIVLAVPLAIVTVALIPAFVICPFLGTDRQRLWNRLLASLRQWTARRTVNVPWPPAPARYAIELTAISSAMNATMTAQTTSSPAMRYHSPRVTGLSPRMIGFTCCHAIWLPHALVPGVSNGRQTRARDSSNAEVKNNDPRFG